MSKNAPRDDYIGWDEPTKRERLPFVVQNVRFLLLPATETPPHLASRVLAANLRRLSRDWQAVYRHPVLLAETFVDESCFQGTCYRSANWLRLGLTRGYGRHSRTYRHRGVPKAAWVYPLRPDALARLRNTHVPVAPSTAEVAMPHPALNPEALPLAGDAGLLDLLLAIAQYAATLSPELLKTLGARRTTPPSEATFRRVLACAPADAVDAAISRWLIEQSIRLDEAIAVDGKVSCGSADGDAAAVHLLSAVLQREGVVIGQVRVSDKTNEIPCVRPLIHNLPIAGALVTADALHTQHETARFLVEEKKADYLFIVKDNQPTLRQDIELLGLTAIPPSG